MENTTFKLENGQIVETTTTEKTYDPLEYVKSLEWQIESMQNGLNEYTATVSSNIQELQAKLSSIKTLIN